MINDPVTEVRLVDGGAGSGVGLSGTVANLGSGDCLVAVYTAQHEGALASTGPLEIGDPPMLDSGNAKLQFVTLLPARAGDREYARDLRDQPEARSLAMDEWLIVRTCETPTIELDGTVTERICPD
jgi:hypothetical protein